MARDQTRRAAGVVLIEPAGRVLFCRRSPTASDHPGEWAFPAGGIEEGETSKEAARRELREETGFEKEPDELQKIGAWIDADGLAFAAFKAAHESDQTPKLCDEHDDFRWALPDDHPIPLHPGAKAVLLSEAEDGDSMLAQDRAETIRGAKRDGGNDALPLAFDKQTVRSYGKDGHLHVASSNISRAAINPYRGSEIPGYEKLGLDANGTYRLLRDPAEIEKAVPTFNNLPILDRHIPVTADAHPNDLVIGSTGTDAAFDGEDFLSNSLVIWPKNAIRDIEEERRKELSSAYHYRADMTPGAFRGEAYDGVMRDIVGNHVALVKQGRAGDEVVVGDSMENVMTIKKIAALTGKGLFACGAVAAALMPKLAMDAKLDVAPIFEGVNQKNWLAKKPGIVAALREQTKGKLAQDADVESVIQLLDKLDGVSPGEAKDADVTEASLPVDLPPPDDTSMDDDGNGVVAKIKEMLAAAGVDPTILAQVDALAAKPATDEFPPKKDDDEEAKKKKADEDAKTAKDKKPAMDAASVQKVVDAAVLNERKANADLRTAYTEVEPYVGKLAIALDSAPEVYGKALTMMNVEHKDVTPEGRRHLLLALPKPGARKVESRIALDEKAEKGFADRFPGAANIQAM